MLNFDSTGASASWRTIALVIAAVVTGVTAWYENDASNVKALDLVAHDDSTSAHAVLHTDPIKKAEVEEMIKPLAEAQRVTSNTVVTVQNGFYEQRAEDLAYRAVDAMPEKAVSRARVRRFDRVKKRALSNQRSDRDIRDGIDVDLL